MSYNRVTTKQIAAIRYDDETTWPTDLQIWVSVCLYSRMVQPPFYLTPEQMKKFYDIGRQKLRKNCEERMSSSLCGLYMASY